MKHILTALAFMLILPSDTLAQTMPDHTAYPPFLCQSTPSVLLILDNSKSMLLPAYGNYYESDPDAPIRGDQEKFKEDEPYSGYFDPDPAGKYFYDTTLNLFTKDNNGSTTTEGWMQGNLLNWIAMRRIDIARKVLVGGKVNTRSGEGQRILIGEKDTPDYPGAAFIKSYENQAKTLDLWFGVKDGSLYVVNKTDVINKEEVFTKGDIYKIEVTAANDPKTDYDDQGNPLGIIQRMGDKVRFGLELFNVQAVETVCSDEAHACKNHDRHGKTGDECTNSGRGIEHRSEKGEWADTWRCTVSDGGKIVVPVDFGDETYTDGSGNKTTHIDDIVTWIEFGKSVVRDYEGNSRGERRQVSNRRGGKRKRQKPGEPSGWAWSPLAEAFREGVRYFRQEKPVYYPDDFEVNKSWDPYYYNDEIEYVPCCNSFIVFITDGQSTDDREAGFKDNDIDGNDPGSDDDYPGNIQERQGSDWLDDIALWAHTNDLRKEDDFRGDQNIILFPIFLNFSQEQDDEQRAVQLLKDAAENGGGVYLEANDGEELEKALLRAINDTRRQIKTASGTSLVVVGNSGGGGTAFHAYFRPSKIIDEKEVNWLGYLQALWVDPYGNLREDNGDKRLDLANDKIIEFSFNKDAKETEIKRYGVDVDNDGNPANDSPTIVSLDDISPIWEAGKMLADRDISADPRNIHTYIEGTTGFTEFKEGNASTLKPYLRAADDAEAKNIINFIRGEDVTGLRDRTIDDAGTVWRLGDIIYSTPAVVRRPMARYIYRYGDTGYYKFLKQYHERETVVYVGANDGMLHAFRAGVFHEGDDPGTESTREYGWYEGNKIGEELWAYIPYNLLPHLKWLSDPNYTHVYYVDLKPRVIDASIFTAGDDHPNGWGTVLIGGMRFGGKGVKIDDFNGSGAPKTFSSAYFALDITNPANPPKLLWEFTHPELGFTTSYPEVAKVDNKWFVIAGSGPADYDGTSDQNAGIFVLDLKTGEMKKRFNLSDNAFMADPVCIDIDLKVDSGYGTEVCYIGMTYRENEKWRSKMLRVLMKDNADPAGWSISTLFETGDSQQQAITSAPDVAMDSHNNLWIYFGTGRFFNSDDRRDKSIQSFYGIKEPCWNNGVFTDCKNSVSNLFNATGADVYEDGTVKNVSDVNNFSGLIEFVASKQGWYIDLRKPGSATLVDGNFSAERSLNKPVVFGGLVLFTTFAPYTDICAQGIACSGEGAMYALYYETGTAYKEAVFENSGTKKVRKRKPLEQIGIPSDISLLVLEDGKIMPYTQTTGGGSEKLQTDPPFKLNKVISWRER